MSDLPPPDLLDSAGRMKRIVISVVIGIAVGVGAYALAKAGIHPEKHHEPAYVSGRQMTAGGFVLWVGLVSGVIALGASLGILNILAKRKWRTEQMPRATVVPPRE